MDILAKAVGRRKEAVAQVQIKAGTGQFIINNKPAEEYLQNDFNKLLTVKAPFEVLSSANTLSNPQAPGDQQRFDTIVKVKGGGLMGQTEAIRLGVSRAICMAEGTLVTLTNVGLSSNTAPSALLGPEEGSKGSPLILDIRKQLKDKGYLTQDSRVKERRKYGLKKARKASQYHKR